MSTPTENDDGTLTRLGLLVLHKYAVAWIDRQVRDLTIERDYPELAYAFYDVRADATWARQQYIPLEPLPVKLAIPLRGK